MMKVKYVTVILEDGKFKIEIVPDFPYGKWQEIGQFIRRNDGQPFLVVGMGIYKGEVDEKELYRQLGEFLGLGKGWQWTS